MKIGSINKGWLSNILNGIFGSSESSCEYPDETYGIDQIDKAIVSQNEGKEKDWLVIFYTAEHPETKYTLYNVVQTVVGIENNIIENSLPADKEKAHYIALVDYLDCYWRPGSQEAQGVKAYYITKTPKYNSLASNLKEFPESPKISESKYLKSANPHFMANFITEMMKRFPAKHVALVVLDGNAWNQVEDSEDNIVKDAITSVSSNLQKALSEVYEKTGRKIDVLALNIPLMATGEIGYALAPYVKYLVAPEYDLPIGRFHIGMKYFPFLPIKDRKVTPEEFARALAELNKDHIGDISVADLSKSKELAKKIDEFSKAVIDAIKAGKVEREDLLALLEKTEKFSTWEYSRYESYTVDVANFAEMITKSKAINSQELKRKAEDLYKFIKEKYVIANYRKDEERSTYGFTLRVTSPKELKNFLRYYYGKTDLAKTTQWDEMVKLLFTGEIK